MMIVRNSTLETDFFHALCNTIQEGAAIIEKKNQQFIFCNNSFYELFGFEPGDTITLASFNGMRKKEMPVETFIRLLDNIEEKGFIKEEVEYLNKKGKYFWVDLTVRQFQNNGECYHLIIIDPIDKVKEAEHVIDLEETRFQAFFEYATMGIVVANAVGEITAINPFALQQFGYTKLQ
jgi:PAS domain S-box-containing protein